MINQDSNEYNLKRIEVLLNEDMTCAYLKLNMTQSELCNYSKNDLITEILNGLKNNGVVFGIKKEILFEPLDVDKEYVVAEGEKAIDGEDSLITMYEVNSYKQVINEAEKANFYEVQQISKVKAGEWLGERINATGGKEGRNVKGEVIIQKKGINYPLYYDKQTVVEISDGNKNILFAKTDGVVNYKEKSIFVSNYLEIDGDVGYGTGNIDFDGFVTVKGTICDSFSVVATKDIEIRNEMGLGNVKKVESIYGSVYIKGGITSKNGSEIAAKKDIYTKFAENSNLKCGGSVHIALYSINCKISALEIIIDSTNGKILGGEISAEMKISAPYIGSESEKKTIVEVRGFDRIKINDNRNLVDLKIEKLKLFKKSLEDAVDFKDKILSGENSCEVIKRLFTIKEELIALEAAKKYLEYALIVKGSGEVEVLKKIFPGVRLIINGMTLDFKSAEIAGSYFVQNDEIKKT